MSHIRQSISWWCFIPAKMTPEALARAAADIGFEALELVDEEYFQLVKDHGLKIASHRAHTSLVDGLNRRENRDAIEKELHHNLALAVKWGIPNLVCFSGNRRGQDDAVGAEITAENLRYFARLVEDSGVTLTLELLNSKIDHPDYQADHTPWGVKVIEMVESPHVKLLYDIYHMQVMEGDVIRTIRDHHRHIAHYHTAGNPGRNEIDEAQELNYRAIAQAIANTGYTGYLGHEFIPTRDPAQELKRAFAICDVEMAR